MPCRTSPTTRNASRTARAAALPVAAALGSLVLVGCGDDGPPQSRPAGPDDLAAVSTSGSPAPTTTSATPTPSATPSPTRTPTPSPTTSAAQGLSTPDGTTYALLRSVSATSLTYDKMDRRAGCDAVGPGRGRASAFAACFSNVNPLQRTVAVSPSALVFVGEEPPLEIGAGALQSWLSAPQNPAAGPYDSYAITVSGGAVTRIEQFLVGGA